MASWIIHLRVAQQLYRQLKIEAVDEFVLGNIAPDSGVPAEDGAGYVPEKSVSHFYDHGADGKKYINEERFIRQYFTPERRAAYTREQDSFYLGYLTHLLTDQIWSREIVIPAKEARSAAYHANRGLFWDTVKTDWYDLDFMYLKSNPAFEVYQIYRKSKNIENIYLDFFPKTAFEERRQFILDFYADGVAAIVEHNTYLSKEDMDKFVISAASEIAARV